MKTVIIIVLVVLVLLVSYLIYTKSKPKSTVPISATNPDVAASKAAADKSAHDAQLAKEAADRANLQHAANIVSSPGGQACVTKCWTVHPFNKTKRNACFAKC